MGRCISTLAVGTIATLVLGFSAAAGALSSIQLRPESGELTSIESIASALTITEEEANFRIICEARKRGRLNSRIAKTAGATWGTATLEVRNCSGGAMRVLGRDWSKTFVSFTGTLPVIREVRTEVRGFAALFETFFEIDRCLYGGNLQLLSHGNPQTNETVDEGRTVPLVSEVLSPFMCPRAIQIKGTFRNRINFGMTLI